MIKVKEEDLKLEDIEYKYVLNSLREYAILYIIENFPEEYNKTDNLKIEIHDFKSKITTLGNYTYRGRSKTHIIRLSEYYVKLNMYGNMNAIYNILKHELIHFICKVKGLDVRDGSDDFENMLRKYGVNSSKTIKNTPRVHYNKKTCRYVYKCVKCGKECKRKEHRERKCRKCKDEYFYTGELCVI